MTSTRRKIKRKAPVNKLARSEKELKAESGNRASLLVKVQKSGQAKEEKGSVKGRELLLKKKVKSKEKKISEQSEQIAEKAIEDYREKIDRQKRMIMWSGVSFFMVLIVLFWLYNTQQIITQSKIEDNNQNDFPQDYWSKLSDELGQELNKLQAGIQDKKTEGIESEAAAKTERANTLPNSEDASTTPPNEVVSTSSENITGLNTEKIETLKNKLESLESKENN